ncbi:hypothetical protein HMI46_26080 [Paenibacillus alvei]|uniref:Transposon Tn7 transposition protein TnsD C-terminal domain-containing protein n=1 Tax=Paenibacillus alvei TaxID=44250 RepID=A0AAP7A1N4_PAEAL|nr:hypothetical protein [Paenibacillus alvei]
MNLSLILLIARFLGGTFERFISEPLNYCCEIPFGLGPWECKNKYCPKYGIKLISHCKRKDNGSRGISGEFFCDFCDSTYVRNWIPGKGAKEGRVIFKNSKKTNQCIVSLLENGHTQKMVASKVYRSEQLVSKVSKDYLLAAQLRVYLSQSEVACSMEKRSKVGDMRKFNFRKKLKSVILDNPELSRSQIRQRCSTAYIWLQKNDIEWLEKNLPPSKLFIRPNWAEIDEDISERIRKAAIQLKKDNYKSRIAEYTLVRALSKNDIGRVEYNIKNLPKTAEALRVCAETKEQYQIRYLPTIVKQLRQYYGYREVSLEVVQSYRRSYRNINEELKRKLMEDLLDLNKEWLHTICASKNDIFT